MYVEREREREGYIEINYSCHGICVIKGCFRAIGAETV